MRKLSPGVERLFFADDMPSPKAPEERRRLVETVLEDGDAVDLRALFSIVDEAELRVWMDRFAARRLSNRSRAFWSLVTGQSVEAAPFRESIWPL